MRSICSRSSRLVTGIVLTMEFIRIAATTVAAADTQTGHVAVVMTTVVLLFVIRNVVQQSRLAPTHHISTLAILLENTSRTQEATTHRETGTYAKAALPQRTHLGQK